MVAESVTLYYVDLSPGCHGVFFRNALVFMTLMSTTSPISFLSQEEGTVYIY